MNAILFNIINHNEALEYFLIPEDNYLYKIFNQFSNIIDLNNHDPSIKIYDEHGNNLLSKQLLIELRDLAYVISREERDEIIMHELLSYSNARIVKDLYKTKLSESLILCKDLDIHQIDIITLIS